MDQAVRDATTSLLGLIADRRVLADALNPALSPLDESESEQFSHAAFSLALSAMDDAISTAPDPRSTLRALRTAIELHANEVNV
ncbi:hypothetical protein [Streptomyces sp. NPDC058045]|uniref:hypothetical protein n=1 Tax=Streptomyces sp. NPDC058045 TaxID=3346311 RepID=UPI0036EE1442